MARRSPNPRTLEMWVVGDYRRKLPVGKGAVGRAGLSVRRCGVLFI